MRATAVVKTSIWYPISGFGQRVGVVGSIPNSIPLIQGSNAELQQPYRPWTWSSNRYVILQAFFSAAPWGPALEEREREKQPSDLQINFHQTLNISCKEPCSRFTDVRLYAWPTDPSEFTPSRPHFYICWQIRIQFENWQWSFRTDQVLGVMRLLPKLKWAKTKTLSLRRMWWLFVMNDKKTSVRRCCTDARSHGHGPGERNRVWIMFPVQANMWSMKDCDSVPARPWKQTHQTCLKKHVST